MSTNVSNTSLPHSDDLETGLSAQRRIFRRHDVFAHSPRDFRHSTSVRASGNISGHFRPAAVDFSLTNNGLHFKAALLVLRPCSSDEADTCYMMSLGCTTGGKTLVAARSTCAIALLKFAPKMFVRVHMPTVKLKTGDEIEYGGWLEEVYIVTTIRPSLSSELLSCHGYSIRVESRHHEASVPFMQVIGPAPLDSWDAASQAFLTLGKPLRGSVGISFETCRISNSLKKIKCFLAFHFQGRQYEANPAWFIGGLTLFTPAEMQVAWQENSMACQRQPDKPRRRQGPLSGQAVQRDFDGFTVEARAELATDQLRSFYRLIVDLRTPSGKVLPNVERKHLTCVFWCTCDD